MPIKGQNLYPFQWYWRADITYSQPVPTQTLSVATTPIPAVPPANPAPVPLAVKK